MFPETAEVLQSVDMELIPCPEVMTTPEGTVQMKVVPCCAVVVYINPWVPEHTEDCPLTTGVEGTELTLTGNVALAEPQEFVIVTPTLPATAEAVQVVTMDAEPDPEAMIAPEGTVHK